jgi:hypothetical protein
MNTRIILPVLALVALGTPAMAQDTGGLNLSAKIGRGPSGLARPLLSARTPFITAQQAQNGMTASDHQAANQNAIGALRGDGGFLSGFQFGTPLAASRQQPQTQTVDDGGYWQRHGHHHDPQTVIINNGGPLAITSGTGNVVQQSVAQGPGPAAQQQIVSLGGSSAGGATNVAGNGSR